MDNGFSFLLTVKNCFFSGFPKKGHFYLRSVVHNRYSLGHLEILDHLKITFAFCVASMCLFISGPSVKFLSKNWASKVTNKWGSQASKEERDKCRDQNRKWELCLAIESHSPGFESHFWEDRCLRNECMCMCVLLRETHVHLKEEEEEKGQKTDVWPQISLYTRTGNAITNDKIPNNSKSYKTNHFCILSSLSLSLSFSSF